MKANGLKASKQSTKCCHLSSILPAATHRLSLCKTDICPGAFFLFVCFFYPFFYPLFFFLSFYHLFYFIYFIFITTFTPGILLRVLKVSAFVRNQGKVSPAKMTFKICDVWLRFSCLLHFAKGLKCLREKSHKHTINKKYKLSCI